MAVAKTAARKGAATRRRKERKNIERGAAHIQSTFNNTIVTITDLRATPCLGRAPASWASADRGNPRLSRLRRLLKPLPKRRWSTV